MAVRRLQIELNQNVHVMPLKYIDKVSSGRSGAVCTCKHMLI